MGNFPFYQVDAFSKEVFGGNPAAVCILEEWFDDSILQKIAGEFNLSETAFLILEKGEYKLRWFTPKAEVDMCGHATLATGHIILTLISPQLKEVTFQTKSGALSVIKEHNNQYKLSLPADDLEVVFYEDGLSSLNIKYSSVFQGKDDYLMILENQLAIERLRPDFKAISKLDKRGLIVTAKGDKVDFVSRCFYPALGVNEDPVTGSAHTLLTPYWSKRLDKKLLTASQLSNRQGDLSCLLKDERVIISGAAKTVMQGTFYL